MRIALCTIGYNRVEEIKQHMSSILDSGLTYDKYIFIDYHIDLQDQIVDLALESRLYREIIPRRNNYGLRKNIIDAVCHLCDQGYDWVCVFEDDVIILENFENYLTQVIQRHPDVSHISLWTPKVFFNSRKSYLSSVPLTGGGYVINSRDFTEFTKDIWGYEPKDLFKFDLYWSYKYSGQYKRNVNGEINTWAVLWYSYLSATNKYTISSGVFWTNNIGFNGKGTNTHYWSFFERGKFKPQNLNLHNYDAKYFVPRMMCAFYLRKVIKTLSKLL